MHYKLINRYLQRTLFALSSARYYKSCRQPLLIKCTEQQTPHGTESKSKTTIEMKDSDPIKKKKDEKIEKDDVFILNTAFRSKLRKFHIRMPTDKRNASNQNAQTQAILNKDRELQYPSL